MSGSEKNAAPPSYTDSISHRRPPSESPIYLPASSSSQPFLARLSRTRTSHLHSVISDHILPMVEHQASFGIAQTIIAMLPSDIPLPAAEEKSEFSFDTADTKAVEVIGFSSESEARIIRLEGQMNFTEFWRVPAVIDELERLLRDRLNQVEALGGLDGPARPRAQESERPRQQKRSFLNRILPSTGPEQRSPSGNPEVGVRSGEGNAGMVLVRARLEELCLRTMNDFGLYDTMSKQCVIIHVDATC